MCTVVSSQPNQKRFYSATILFFIMLLCAALALAIIFGIKQGLLLLLGGAFGLTLYHAAFGFTSAWSAFIRQRKGRGVRAQMLMLAVAVVLFFPALHYGSIFGTPIAGSLAPLSLSVIVGAFIFGIGMQLGGGCASGTLFTLGGGNLRMLIVLLFFIIGALISTAHSTFWASTPAIAPISLPAHLGTFAALGLSLILFSAVAYLTLQLEKARNGTIEQKPTTTYHGWERFLKGPWPLFCGAIMLATLNFMTLAITGKPWSIAGAFPVWGAKLAAYLGLNVSDWAFWQVPGNAQNLASSVFNNVTSIMDFGIIAGAMLAASLAGRFHLRFKMPMGSFFAAIIGGLLLGYGARIAYGCNIGAYFSGIASGSLHGWLWVGCAFVGNIVGITIKPLFFGKSPIA